MPGPVRKMKWGKRKDPETGKKVDGHTALIYNENLVIRDIPEARSATWSTAAARLSGPSTATR